MTNFRKNSLFIFLLILSFKGFAQNYEPVIAGKEYLYSVSDKSTLNKPFYNIQSIGPVGIRVKNDTTIGQRKFYFFNGHIRNSCDSISCFGKKELVEEGRCVFFNGKGDSIIFKKNQPKGSTWPIYTYPDGSYLQAGVIGVEAITVLKYTDTAKFISLTYRNKVGNTLSHIFNNKTFILSKNLGLIRTYDLAAFPADTTTLHLSGISSPALGIQNIKGIDIFDFEVGDEFHYEAAHRTFDAAVSTFYKYSTVILGKTLAADGKVATYNVENKSYQVDYNHSTKKEYFRHDTTTTDFASSSSTSGVNDFPFEGYLMPGHSHTEISVEYDTVFKTVFSNYIRGSFSNSSSCFVYPLGVNIYNEYTYAAGRGMVSQKGYKSGTQVYYKKKNKEWGTPINFPKLVSNEAPTEASHSLEISPNPASDFVNIKSKSQAFIGAISISNLLGSEMLSQEISPNTLEAQVDVSSLSNGIYLLRTKNGSGEHVTKFVVGR